MNTKVSINNSQDALSIDENQVKRFVLNILDHFNIETDEIIINFVSEDKIKVLHGLFFNTTETTDCITFPMDGQDKSEDETHTLGECFINPKEALNYLPAAPYHELSRYIIHCILHLIGHEDKTDNQKEQMRKLEDKALDYLESKKMLLSKPDPLYT
ncbi:MAG: Endoribonuclease YbeY [Chlamydiia bacterium]|nr:Endoribonuclease YbeY [Chlamydiia bacterium]